MKSQIKTLGRAAVLWRPVRAYWVCLQDSLLMWPQSLTHNPSMELLKSPHDMVVHSPREMIQKKENKNRKKPYVF